MDGTKLPLLQESRKGRRRLGWQLPETTTTENTTSARNSNAPSNMTASSKLPETPELTGVQSRNTN